jgi:hypothetical protein
MVLLQSEVQKTVADQTVTKVNGPPTSNDLNLLKEKLIVIAASIPSVLGGEMNGHARTLLSDIDYATMAPGSPFVAPVNPGVYPVGVTAATRSRMEAEHKEQVNQFHTFVGVGVGLKDLVLKAIDKDYLLEIKHICMAFLNMTAAQMLTTSAIAGEWLILLTSRHSWWSVMHRGVLMKYQHFISIEWRKQ